MKLLKSRSDKSAGKETAETKALPVKKVLGKKGSDLSMPRLSVTHVIVQELLAHALFFALNAVVVFALPYDERQGEVVVVDQNFTNHTDIGAYYPRPELSTRLLVLGWMT